jgi:hypothetical protein
MIITINGIIYNLNNIGRILKDGETNIILETYNGTTNITFGTQTLRDTAFTTIQTAVSKATITADSVSFKRS